jgi:hypothetical protein
MTAPRAERAITVLVDEQQRPAAFRLGRRRLEVQRVLDEWEEAGCWRRGLSMNCTIWPPRAGSCREYTIERRTASTQMNADLRG